MRPPGRRPNFCAAVLVACASRVFEGVRAAAERKRIRSAECRIILEGEVAEAPRVD
jgi:hypothetical protein